MKRRHLFALPLLVVVGLLLAAMPASAARPTTPKVTITTVFGPTLPVQAYRFDGETVLALKRVYFLGWRLADNTTDGSIWYFDLTTHTYVNTGVVMPVPISNYEVAMLTDSRGLGLYTFGGRDNNGVIITTVQVYYPALNRATVVASDPWPGTTPAGCVSLPAMGAVVQQNKAYVLGGESFSTSLPPCVDDNSAQTWTFDPMAPAGTRWTQGPDLNVARGYISAAALNGKIYAVGGNQNVAGTLTAVATVESWKPGTPAWNDTGVADLPQGCDESQAFGFTAGPLAKGIALMGCGQWPNDLPDIYFYDAVGNTWSDVGALLQSRRNQAGALIGSGRMVLFGGATAAGGTILDSSEIGHGGAFAARPGFTRPAVGSSANPSTN